jgi:hypothetical protein
MQRLKIKDQIQLTHIFKQPIERLYINLYQIDERQRGFRARRDDDEVKRRVVAVGDEGRDVVVGCGGIA